MTIELILRNFIRREAKRSPRKNLRHLPTINPRCGVWVCPTHTVTHCGVHSCIHTDTTTHFSCKKKCVCCSLWWILRCGLQLIFLQSILVLLQRSPIFLWCPVLIKHCIYKYRYYIYLCIYMNICIYMNVSICIYIYICIYICIYIYVHVYVQIFMYIYIHIYVYIYA